MSKPETATLLPDPAQTAGRSWSRRSGGSCRYLIQVSSDTSCKYADNVSARSIVLMLTIFSCWVRLSSQGIFYFISSFAFFLPLHSSYRPLAIANLSTPMSSRETNSNKKQQQQQKQTTTTTTTKSTYGVILNGSRTCSVA